MAVSANWCLYHFRLDYLCYHVFEMLPRFKVRQSVNRKKHYVNFKYVFVHGNQLEYHTQKSEGFSSIYFNNCCIFDMVKNVCSNNDTKRFYWGNIKHSVTEYNLHIYFHWNYFSGTVFFLIVMKDFFVNICFCEYGKGVSWLKFQYSCLILVLIIICQALSIWKYEAVQYLPRIPWKDFLRSCQIL